MKIIVSLLVGLFVFALAGGAVQAQKRKITIILLRHAEKDLSDGGASSDPDLSPEGRRRAERLVRVIGKYKPMRLYATEYKRTRETAAPLAKKRNLTVKTYNPRELKALADEITSFKKGRRIVVVGHNTTTPALANLLAKTDQYQALLETEYDKIWIIRLKKGKVSARVIRY
jgi:2,3-bisphosphoglycerate-dependent phosphoglycerate mutase